MVASTLTSASSPKDVWFVDSCASNQMTSHEEWFRDLRAPDRVRIVIGHNQLLVYVRGCKDRDKYAQTEILRTEHERNRGTQDINVENPKVGKNYGGPQTPRKQNHYDERNYNKRIRGNNLELFFVNRRQ